MKYGFYPGCSLETSAIAYGQSVDAICQTLGIELVPIPDWNCCGATEFWTQDRLTAQTVIARNLALANGEVKQITAPCAACYLNLIKVDKQMAEFPEINRDINRALAAGGLHYEPGSVRIRPLIDVLYEDVGEEWIRARVRRPLEGLKVAPYYGCQVVRPYDEHDDPEHPQRMDELLTWLGAEAVDFPAKAYCCGGHMTQISENEAFEMIRRLLMSADTNGADVIACMCPMCQLNLDGYQARVNQHFHTNYALPALFFTQIIGLAFGFEDKEIGIGKEIVPAKAMLAKLEAAETAEGQP